jgi:hypothetical protein
LDAFATNVLPAIEAKITEVRSRFHNTGIHSARITDVRVRETDDHHSPGFLVEALPETPFWDAASRSSICSSTPGTASPAADAAVSRQGNERARSRPGETQLRRRTSASRCRLRPASVRQVAPESRLTSAAPPEYGSVSTMP